MKKWIKNNWSYVLNVILALLIVLVIWPEDETPVDLSKFTQNDLSKAIEIKPGMSIEKMLTIMGKPALKEITEGNEEFHYCKTGHLVDEYISIKAKQEKVSDMSYYVVNWLDVAFHHTPTPNKHMLEIGGLGDCKLTIRWGNYDEKTPKKSMQPTAKASVD